MVLPVSAHHPQPRRTLTPALLAVMWIVLFGFGTFFLNYSTLVPIGSSLGLRAVTAGTVLTVMMIAVVVVQPVAPLLKRLLGPRHTFLLALGLQAVGNLLSLLTQVPLLATISGSVIGGLGFGVLVVLGTAVVPSTVTPDRLGKALGFFGATTASATAIGAPAGLWLVEIMPITGFRWLTFGLIILALPALAAIPRHESTVHPDTANGEHETQSPDRRVNWSGLVTVLLPVLMALTTFGLILAFGPAAEVTNPALYILSMQVFTIFGRFIASASLDRHAPVSIMNIATVIALLGLIFSALLPAGAGLIAAMVVLGFGIGAIQASSLLLCFNEAGSNNRGSVAWNMTFDIGLGIAGLVGGFGFTYWGPTMTYVLCAIALTLTGLFFALWFLSPRRSTH